MEIDLTIFQQLAEYQNAQQLLDTSVDVILNENNKEANFSQYRKGLSHKEKIIVSKLIGILQKLAVLPKQELKSQLQSISKLSTEVKSYLSQVVLPNIFFSRTLNNYCLIKFHIDRAQSIGYESQVIEQKDYSNQNTSKMIFDAAKIEWKIEVTLASIKLKKVVRPLILLTIHTKQGVIKNIYMDAYQFQELRKNLALILKHFHQIELR